MINWFDGIVKKNKEAIDKGLSYGQLIAQDWEKRGRPEIKAQEPEEASCLSSAKSNRNASEATKTKRKCIEKNREKYAKHQAVIREMREKKGLTKMALAGMAGVSAHSICSWEIGEIGRASCRERV